MNDGEDIRRQAYAITQMCFAMQRAYAHSRWPASVTRPLFIHAIQPMEATR